MRLRACFALLLYVSACATSAPGPREPVDGDPRYANLQRAAALPETRPVPITQSAPPKPLPEQKPRPEPKGPDLPPVGPLEVTEQERRSRCEPIPERHEGNDDAHNRCADQFPPNRYPGMDVLVDGVSFDALQVGVRVLWEIKTHRFDTYSDFLQDMEIEKQMKQMNKQRKAAVACGYDFIIGVSTQAHKDALLRKNQALKVVVTGCTR